MMTCKPGDVVDVPFPFIDIPEIKRRPALVLSQPRFHQASGTCILMGASKNGPKSMKTGRHLEYLPTVFALGGLQARTWAPSSAVSRGALMMVTSAARSRLETDIELEDWGDAGLRKASILRWKVFTNDEQLIVSRRGALSERDRRKVCESLEARFSHWVSR